MKVALYARYSSDNQRDASIADQLRVCRAYADDTAGRLRGVHRPRGLRRDVAARGLSGADARCAEPRFDIVLAESLDRFSRDQEDTAGSSSASPSPA